MDSSYASISVVLSSIAKRRLSEIVLQVVYSSNTLPGFISHLSRY